MIVYVYVYLYYVYIYNVYIYNVSNRYPRFHLPQALSAETIPWRSRDRGIGWHPGLNGLPDEGGRVF
jgi:hypothetical protein